jgi:hypothetical protein
MSAMKRCGSTGYVWNLIAKCQCRRALHSERSQENAGVLMKRKWSAKGYEKNAQSPSEYLRAKSHIT